MSTSTIFSLSKTCFIKIFPIFLWYLCQWNVRLQLNLKYKKKVNRVEKVFFQIWFILCLLSFNFASLFYYHVPFRWQEKSPTVYRVRGFAKKNVPCFCSLCTRQWLKNLGKANGDKVWIITHSFQASLSVSSFTHEQTWGHPSMRHKQFAAAPQSERKRAITLA